MLKGQTFNKKRGRRNLRSDGMSWKCLAASSSSSCVTDSRPRDSFLLPAEKKLFRDFRNANVYQKTVEWENEKKTKMCVFHNYIYNKSFPKKRRCTLLIGLIMIFGKNMFSTSSAETVDWDWREKTTAKWKGDAKQKSTVPHP